MAHDKIAYRLQLAAANAKARPSGVFEGATKHSLFSSGFGIEDALIILHHVIMSECPHPDKKKADVGESYMVGYISIPFELIPTEDMRGAWNVSFIGPAGIRQKLPPKMQDMELLLGERIYLGFDTPTENRQQTQNQLYNHMIKCVQTLRGFA